jgi:hypothetical protein
MNGYAESSSHSREKKEIQNRKKGALPFPAEENHRLMVMNSQHSSNPIGPIEITK